MVGMGGCLRREARSFDYGPAGLRSGRQEEAHLNPTAQNDVRTGTSRPSTQDDRQEETHLQPTAQNDKSEAVDEVNEAGPSSLRPGRHRANLSMR